MPDSDGAYLCIIVSRSTAAAPNGTPGKSTQSLSIQDATYGNTLYTATLLASTGDVLEWQSHTYDDKNRRCATHYSDGSSSTNAYSCCRLLWTIDRSGNKVLRSAKTGQDHLYYAMEEVSLRKLTEADPYYYAPARYFRVTQHFMDSLGNTVTHASTTHASALFVQRNVRSHFMLVKNNLAQSCDLCNCRLSGSCLISR